MQNMRPMDEQGNVDPMGQSRIQRQLEMVREGMKVVDAAGNDIGKVGYVKIGDPDAVTTQGETSGQPGVGFGAVPLAIGGNTGQGAAAAPVFWPFQDDGPDIPEPIRARLMRDGFFKVDGPFLFGKDRYVRGDLIANVAGDTVHLRVDKDRLPVEGQDTWAA